jgi:hypothetical protein
MVGKKQKRKKENPKGLAPAQANSVQQYVQRRDGYMNTRITPPPISKTGTASHQIGVQAWNLHRPFQYGYSVIKR